MISRHILASGPWVTGPSTLGAGGQRQEAWEVTAVMREQVESSWQHASGCGAGGRDDQDAGRPADRLPGAGQTGAVPSLRRRAHSQAGPVLDPTRPPTQPNPLDSVDQAAG